jgi:hypothetical protein
MRPDHELTVLEFAKRHPDKLTREHFIVVLKALIDGTSVPQGVIKQYPSIQSVLDNYTGKDALRELKRLLKKTK